ncbi:hypothetical protein [Cerasicoccus maritimus]|uniref:hypothetical protein n=1 Tax=Cerasicoccus maritimus TaxID=490089 RepID=UPI00285268B1|nr:hypothetical protein [Cerasicoccus maritimus]
MIFLLISTLVTLTQIETHSSTVQGSQTKAQQNALFALNTAIGQLQRHSGPDQRVTGQADIVIPSSVTVASNATGEEVRDQLDTYWNAQRNRHWTGVWKMKEQTDPFDANNPIASSAEPELQTWLVSGNEINGDVKDPSYLPTDAVTGLSDGSNAYELIAGVGTDYRLLVSPGQGVGAEALKRAVTVPEVALYNEAGAVNGHYAWWVGDEGVKARINLIDPYDVAIPTAEEKLRRLSAAQRTVAEAIVSDSEDSIATYYTPNAARLDEARDLSDMSLLLADVVNRDAYNEILQESFHDVTLHSEGVLADAKDGGLKLDLSYIFGQTTQANMRAAMDAGMGASVTNTHDGVSRVLTTDFTKYAEIPTNASSGGKYNPALDPGMFTYTPTWEQLWSYYHMGAETSQLPVGVFNNIGQAVPRVHTKTEHGISPIVTQAKLFFRLRINSTIKIEVVPLVVLANPYSVPLAPAEYQIAFEDGSKFSSPTLKLKSGSPANPSADPQDGNGADFPTTLYTLDDAGLTSIRFTIDCENGIGAGEAQIYMLDQLSETLPDKNASGSTKLKFNPVMVAGYSPDSHLVYDTGLTIPEEDTHVTLYMDAPRLGARLYLGVDIDAGEAMVDSKLLHWVNGWSYSGDRLKSAYVVYPTSGPTELVSEVFKEGGGAFFALYDVYFNKDWLLHSALFYQQNYRTNIIDGHHGYTGSTHLKEWAYLRGKDGSPNNEKYLGAHLLRPSGDLYHARWGVINTGVANYDSTAPSMFNTPDVGLQNFLYDVPSGDVPLTSLGQLQHFNTSAYIDRNSWWNSYVNGRKVSETTTVQSWQMNYPIANSYAHPRVDRQKVINNMYSGYHYDGSYLWNDILWDRFYFSTYPTTGDFDFNTDILVNSRFHPFRPEDEVASDVEENFRGPSGLPTLENTRMAAQNLLVAGAFNVNSTSRDAWRAVFSGLREAKIGSETNSSNLTAPFPRNLHLTGSAENSQAADHPNGWVGFRNLTQSQIDDLADEMVLQVQLRGPFLSLADFVNRKLVESGDDPNDLGVSGALQSAIDAVVNQTSELTLSSGTDADYVTELVSSSSNTTVDPDFRLPSVAGYPGYLLQGDVLSAIGPSLSARSDTFRIRAYGDSTNALTGEVDSRAWCEAIVQRLPDYVDGGNLPYESGTNLSSDNETFGRRYAIVSFRWLTPDEI